MAPINFAVCKQADAFRPMPDAGSDSSNHCRPNGFTEQIMEHPEQIQHHQTSCYWLMRCLLKRQIPDPEGMAIVGQDRAIRPPAMQKYRQSLIFSEVTPGKADQQGALWADIIVRR